MRILLTAAMLITTATAALAGPIPFSTGWKEQRLSLFSSNDYDFGESLQMVSDGSVSIAWSRVGASDWAASNATWDWSVSESVPATDLSLKGGDDRNLSLYFVFVPDAVAPDLEGAGIRSLLGRKDVRVIQYAWGGNNPVGEVIRSPYGSTGSGVTIPLRLAGTGSASASVNLAADYARSFEGPKGSLVGVAVSGDSDDTDSRIVARISNFAVK